MSIERAIVIAILVILFLVVLSALFGGPISFGRD